MMTIITKCVWVQMVNQVKENQIGRNNYRGSKYRKQSPRGFWWKKMFKMLTGRIMASQ